MAHGSPSSDGSILFLQGKITARNVCILRLVVQENIILCTKSLLFNVQAL